MPLPREMREEMERQRAAEHEQASRDAFWANIRTGLMCLGWSAAGLVVMGLGLHTTDEELGQVFWRGGMVLGYAGILLTMVRWYLKRQDRGDA